MLGKVVPSINVDEQQRLNTAIPLFEIRQVGVDCIIRKLEDVLEYILTQLDALQWYAPENHQVLQFSCDGAKLTKKLNSLRGMFKVLVPRNKLPDEIEKLSMSPNDELTLYFYLGFWPVTGKH